MECQSPVNPSHLGLMVIDLAGHEATVFVDEVSVFHTLRGEG